MVEDIFTKIIKDSDTMEVKDAGQDESVVVVSNLSKIYSSKLAKAKAKSNGGVPTKGIKALDNVSFSVKKGEIFGLVGANGSGKTTFIKILCGLIKDDGGTIKVFGKDIHGNREEIVKDLGAIVEAPTLFKDMTGIENLNYFAMLQGGLPAGRTDDVIELVGLGDRKKSKFSTYSLGMKQRLGIAQAIMHNPKLLVFDEPINGLDPDGIIQVRDLLLKIREAYGTTIIISSHILSELDALCDRVAILDKGHVVTVKSLEELEGQTEGKTIAKIECDNPTKAFDILSAEDGLEVKLVGGFVYVRFLGDRMAEINKKLVLQDILVKSIAVKKRTLEDVYKELMDNAK